MSDPYLTCSHCGVVEANETLLKFKHRDCVAKHYYCDVGTEDPTPVHRCNQTTSPGYVFREGIDPVAYEIFCGEDSEIIHEACAKAPPDREFPLYDDDIQAYRNLEPIQCFMCGEQIAAEL